MANLAIHNLTDLHSKRIGVENTAVGAIVLDAALEKAGLSLTDSTLASLTADEHVEAYRAGVVDAVVTFEPTLSQIVDLGGSLLFDSSEIPGRIIDVLVVSAERLPQHTGALQRLVDGYFVAQTYLHEYPDDAAQRMATRFGVSGKEVLRLFNGLSLPGRDKNKRALLTLDAGLDASVKRFPLHQSAVCQGYPSAFHGATQGKG